MAGETYNYSLDLNSNNPLKDCVEGQRFEQEVTVCNCKYNKEINGFAIYEVEKDEFSGRFTISGVFSEKLVLGGRYIIKGKVTFYKGELQVSCFSYNKLKSTDNKEIQMYLEQLDDSLAFYAKDIVSKFGDKSISVLKNEPEKIIASFSDLDVDKVIEWQKILLDKDVATYSTNYLKKAGFSQAEITRLIRRYGSNIAKLIEEDAYFLVGHDENFTFENCDKIALNNGVELNNLSRLENGIIYTLQKEVNEQGNTFIKKKELLNRSRTNLAFKIPFKEAARLFSEKRYIYNVGKLQVNINEGFLNEFIYENKGKDASEKKKIHFPLYEPSDRELKEAISMLVQHRKVVEESGCIYLSDFYNAEILVGKKIWEFSRKSTPRNKEIEKYLIEYLKEKNIILEKEQMNAVRGILNSINGIDVINGGPGTGKTFLVKIVAEVLDTEARKNFREVKIKLLAPTGRAAQRLSESTGKEAHTIHYELGLKMDGTADKNEMNQIPADVIIIDEFSMVDIELASKLFAAIDVNTKVIIIGDINQLPAIGAGKVLQDLIECERVKTYKLVTTRRQGKKSTIIENAMNIIDHKMITSDSEKKDALVFKVDSPQKCFEKILSIIDRYLESGVSINDIQVLSPNRNGGIGSLSLNTIIQERLNPRQSSEKELFLYDCNAWSMEDQKMKKKRQFLRIGDKVIHTRNDYRKTLYKECEFGGYEAAVGQVGVFNGQTGVVYDIYSEQEYGRKINTVVVKLDNDLFALYKDDINSLEIAYALTAHKSQGSEWPIVIMPVMTQSANMLTRNLFYTEYTRAKKVAIVIGELEAITYAIFTDDSKERNSNLKLRIESSKGGRL